LILSAEESSGLATWLSNNGYRLPEGAAPVLEHYLAEGMRFFVARVNLQERSKLGFSNLRPLQIAFESSAFMLPIRLGMINAAGPQELFVYTLTRNGRVEAANYRTVEMPSDLDVPIFVKEEFGAFYRAGLVRSLRRRPPVGRGADRAGRVLAGRSARGDRRRIACPRRLRDPAAPALRRRALPP
jgi:hypothetical protein